MRWHGALFLDYFFDVDTKTPSYIECNARPGGFFIAQLAGCDLGEQFLKTTLDQQALEPLPIAAEGARFHQSMVMLLSRAMEGASRRQLAREIWDSCWKAGFYQRSEDTVTRVGDDWLSLFPRLGISLLLLLRPAAANGVVRGTIAKYALPEETARRIRE